MSEMFKVFTTGDRHSFPARTGTPQWRVSPAAYPLLIHFCDELGKQLDGACLWSVLGLVAKLRWSRVTKNRFQTWDRSSTDHLSPLSDLDTTHEYFRAAVFLTCMI